MSILQGFPRNYKFVASSRSNMYRHIGDAVPPLISYQLAKVCEWILSNQRPSIDSVILPHTHLTVGDIEAAPEKQANFEPIASAPALI
jgi:DNA (cytosine-5)-methyltransferase 1